MCKAHDNNTYEADDNNTCKAHDNNTTCRALEILTTEINVTEHACCQAAVDGIVTPHKVAYIRPTYYRNFGRMFIGQVWTAVQWPIVGRS